MEINVGEVRVSKAAWVYLGISAGLAIGGIAAELWAHRMKLKETQKFLNKNEDILKSNPHLPLN